MDVKDQTVIEGEVSPPASAEDLVTITNLIQSYIGNIDRATEEMRAHKQMLTDAFSNDPTYRDQEEKVKEAVKIRNTTKQQILKQPTFRELSEKVKEMSVSVKEMKEGLSNYLQDYARMTGSREIEDSEGEIREIVYVARLVKTANKRC